MTALAPRGGVAAPTTLDVAAILTRYQAGLRNATDVELEHRAATVAALPGRLAVELRHLVDVERDRRQATRRPDRSRVALAAAGAVVGGPAAVLAGQALAEHAAVVPQGAVYSSAAVVGLVAAALGASRLVEWFGDLRHPLAVDVDEADLDEVGRELLARVRAERLARGELR